MTLPPDSQNSACYGISDVFIVLVEGHNYLAKDSDGKKIDEATHGVNNLFTWKSNYSTYA